MASIRETLQAEIAELQNSLAVKQNELAQFENSVANLLDKDVDAVKSFVLSIWGHVFGTAPTPAAPVAPENETQPQG